MRNARSSSLSVRDTWRGSVASRDPAPLRRFEKDWSTFKKVGEMDRLVDVQAFHMPSPFFFALDSSLLNRFQPLSLSAQPLATTHCRAEWSGVV